MIKKIIALVIIQLFILTTLGEQKAFSLAPRHNTDNIKFNSGKKIQQKKKQQTQAAMFAEATLSSQDTDDASKQYE